MRRLFLLAISLLLLVNCAQNPEKTANPGPDEQAVTKGLKLLSTPDDNDKKVALQAFEKACNLGNSYGCHKVGIAYNNGLYGFDKNYERAKEWYLKAAEKGYAASQQNIANLYAYRLLGEMDDVEGYKWLVLAEKTTAECLPGSVEVEGSVSETERRRLCSLASYGQGKIKTVFRKRMSFTQIEQAEQEAHNWTPSK